VAIPEGIKSKATATGPLHELADVAASIGKGLTEFMAWPIEDVEWEIAGFRVREKISALEHDEFDRKLERERKKRERGK